MSTSMLKNLGYDFRICLVIIRNLYSGIIVIYIRWRCSCGPNNRITQNRACSAQNVMRAVCLQPHQEG
jgi:hypothetical protein